MLRSQTAAVWSFKCDCDWLTHLTQQLLNTKIAWLVRIKSKSLISRPSPAIITAPTLSSLRRWWIQETLSVRMMRRLVQNRWRLVATKHSNLAHSTQFKTIRTPNRDTVRFATTQHGCSNAVCLYNSLSENIHPLSTSVGNDKEVTKTKALAWYTCCLLYTSPSPRD